MMKNKLFGQHIVTSTVPPVIKHHLLKDEPKKALVISFHGTTGIGKTYVADMIAEYIYGSKDSIHAYTFMGEDFRDPRQIESYKKTIKESVIRATRQCARSLFIFSEIESMQFGVLDVLTPYLDYQQHVDHVNYRKNIFLFLSNIGGHAINNLTVENIQQGQPRESLSRTKLEALLSRNALVSGGFEKNHLIISGLVDFFIPFLPLESFHVKQCVLEEVSMRVDDNGKERCGGVLLELVDKVAAEVAYDAGLSNLAVHGCKMIDKKVDMLI